MEIGNDVINCGMNNAPQSMGWHANDVTAPHANDGTTEKEAIGVGWGDKEGGRESLYSTKPLQEL